MQASADSDGDDEKNSSSSDTEFTDANTSISSSEADKENHAQELDDAVPPMKKFGKGTKTKKYGQESSDSDIDAKTNRILSQMNKNAPIRGGKRGIGTTVNNKIFEAAVSSEELAEHERLKKFFDDLANDSDPFEIEEV